MGRMTWDLRKIGDTYYAFELEYENVAFDSEICDEYELRDLAYSFKELSDFLIDEVGEEE